MLSHLKMQKFLVFDLLQVIKKAELMAPATPELLLSPGAVYSVRTNKDHTHSLSYTLLSGQGLITLDQGNLLFLN